MCVRPAAGFWMANDAKGLSKNLLGVVRADLPPWGNLGIGLGIVMTAAGPWPFARPGDRACCAEGTVKPIARRPGGGVRGGRGRTTKSTNEHEEECGSWVMD